MSIGEAKMDGSASNGVYSLLNNMPAMVFYKSAVDGRYVACNQLFSEFVNKRHPQEVVGLTDHDLFDEDVVTHLANDDKITLSTDEPHVFFEDVPNAAGELRRLQTAKRSFADDADQLCILGMSMDVTEVMQTKAEREQAHAAYEQALNTSAVFQSMINALAQDYFDLFYVNVETEEYLEYGLRAKKDQRTDERRGTDFFAECQRNAAGLVYDEDLEQVLEALTKERLLAKVAQQGAYVYYYRLVIDGVPTHVRLKATSIPNDDQHIIIGVSNVDAQVRDRITTERAMEDRRSYLRLSALVGNLIVLYYVNPTTSEYTEFSTSAAFETLGIAKRGADFFKTSYKNALNTIHPEDQELFFSHVTKENVLATIKRDGLFMLDYRLMSDGLPTYVRLSAALVEEGGTSTLIIGLLDEDAQIKREREYARNLSAAREKAVIDSLTGVKNKHAYSEWEEKIDVAIRKGEQQPFAVAVCDVNGLKMVNDLYGHKEGDACIKRSCARICRIFGHSPVFRVGGDEFVVILSGEDYEHRSELMDLINAVPLDGSPIKAGETIAAGVAEYQPNVHLSLLSVFEEADKRMYKIKKLMKESLPIGGQTTEEKPADEAMDLNRIPAINARRCILVADDAKLQREMLGELLMDDYDILYASNGIEALEVLRAHKDEVALVILDLYMPQMSGRDVIAEMQIDDSLMSIPVIFLTIDQNAELDCLRIGAMDFIPKPYPDIEIVKARIAKCIELSEGRDLIRHTERDRLTGLLNKEFFFRYVQRLDRIHRNASLDAVVFDVNKLHTINKHYGRRFGDHVLRTVGAGIGSIARHTDGIGCRAGGDTFFLYCPHQYSYDELLDELLASELAREEMTDKVSLRYGVFGDAQQEPDIEERFVRAKDATDSVRSEGVSAE